MNKPKPWIVFICLVALTPFGLADTSDDQLYQLARTDMPAFARAVSAGANSESGRAQAIVHWLAKNFEWMGTDYRKRTVQQIVERRGGNCNDLAMVARAAMKSLNMRLRDVHEVNVHVISDERGVSAREMVTEKGPGYHRPTRGDPTTSEIRWLAMLARARPLAERFRLARLAGLVV
jgi:hypothetical protein